ncbi:histidine phosphatase family protein [Cryobacterium zongtaii]|uniref:Histidine phosphatase family protein n=1 Tax=Cryobacterium zongtaii TaxID=1259217 RepID=A0A2S3ZJD7_9MICO|nr:histidine phosphatase family protein [Cryobacterium zongtaii]
MTKFAIVRHGQTDWNLERRIQGSTDIPLNSTGRAQAAETGLRLSRRHWDAVVTSPLLRAHESARIIAGELDLPAPLVVPELTERHHGQIEGLTFAQRQARFPDGSSVPGLETRQAVLDRVLPALEDVAQTYAGREVVVVCHGGVIGTLLRYATEGTRPAAGELIPNGSIHEFRWESGRLQLEDVVSAR